MKKKIETVSSVQPSAVLVWLRSVGRLHGASSLRAGLVRLHGAVVGAVDLPGVSCDAKLGAVVLVRSVAGENGDQMNSLCAAGNRKLNGDVGGRIELVVEVVASVPERR